jgi:hypothetical protein
MSACGEDTSTPTSSIPPSEDTAQAYEALSRSLEACEDKQDACTAAAAGDATKVAGCESQAADCKQKTEAAADHARDNLARDANSCWKRCGHGDDDAGTANDDDGGTEDMHGCVEHHAPPIPGCVFSLVDCLRDVAKSRPKDPRAPIFACISDADACFRDAFEARRDGDRGNHGPGGNQGQLAGQGASAGGAGSPAPAANGGSGGNAGSGGAAGSSNGWGNGWGQGQGPGGWNWNNSGPGKLPTPFERGGKRRP